jgi:hypothetical protein
MFLKSFALMLILPNVSTENDLKINQVNIALTKGPSTLMLEEPLYRQSMNCLLTVKSILTWTTTNIRDRRWKICYYLNKATRKNGACGVADLMLWSDYQGFCQWWIGGGFNWNNINLHHPRLYRISTQLSLRLLQLNLRI